MTIETCIWGNAQWFILHMLSFNYPEIINDENKQVKKDMYNYLMALGSVLPCPDCKLHFFENINRKINGFTLDESLNSKEKFTRWMYEFHNLVNKQIGKTNIPTFEEVHNKFNPLVSSSCESSCNSGSSDKYCKVEILNKNSFDSKNIERFVILFLIIVIIILAYLCFSKVIKVKR